MFVLLHLNYARPQLQPANLAIRLDRLSKFVCKLSVEHKFYRHTNVFDRIITDGPTFVRKHVDYKLLGVGELDSIEFYALQRRYFGLAVFEFNISVSVLIPKFCKNAAAMQNIGLCPSIFALDGQSWCTVSTTSNWQHRSSFDERDFISGNCIFVSLARKTLSGKLGGIDVRINANLFLACAGALVRQILAKDKICASWINYGKIKCDRDYKFGYRFHISPAHDARLNSRLLPDAASENTSNIRHTGRSALRLSLRNHTVGGVVARKLCPPTSLLGWGVPVTRCAPFLGMAA